MVVVALLTLGVGRQEGEGLSREDSKVIVSGWGIITQDGNCGGIVQPPFD